MAAYPIRTVVPEGTSHGMIHSFPAQSKVVERRTPRYFSEVQTLDIEGSKRMLGVTKDIVERANTLVDYVDRNRHEARLSGVETIAIELSAILEGGKLLRVEDALEEAVREEGHPAITIEGFSKLRRAEYLIGEADHEIVRYAETPVREMGFWKPYSGPQPRLGALSDIPTPYLILGGIGLGVILTLIIIAISKK